jgi:hypothetical protein
MEAAQENKAPSALSAGTAVVAKAATGPAERNDVQQSMQPAAALGEGSVSDYDPVAEAACAAARMPAAPAALEPVSAEAQQQVHPGHEGAHIA